MVESYECANKSLLMFIQKGININQNERNSKLMKSVVLHHDDQWIKEQLNTYNVSDANEVFYAGLNSADVFYVSKKQKRKIEYYNKLS